MRQSYYRWLSICMDQNASREKLLEYVIYTPLFVTQWCICTYTDQTTLFFTKGSPTQNIWFYEHPYPPGVKSYNKTKPMKIGEFDAETAWWGKEKDGFKKRVVNEYAWKISIEEIKARNYNLDCKNPHVHEQESHDPEELLAQYDAMQNDIAFLRKRLRNILSEALASTTEKKKTVKS